ncbi:5'-methylthioadenosine/adenosylhomocysteine nucleosidase, partial [Francisella tularensis subsp. holarctica]|nr:5'-methylthioadenosine/adenosylhomocysteine nucleosidase [Francisella tularensis subsp. holarctica]
MRKIAIIGAMEIEILTILAKLDNYETIEYANKKYYLAYYQDQDLVIAYSKIGKVFSSLTA